MFEIMFIELIQLFNKLWTGETQPPFHIAIQVVLKSGIYVVMSLGLVHSLHAERTTSGCTLCVLLS